MDTTRLLATFRPVVSTSATTTRSPGRGAGVEEPVDVVGVEE
jgi:hypothetical protein